jgi:hypothetical protein
VDLSPSSVEPTRNGEIAADPTCFHRTDAHHSGSFRLPPWLNAFSERDCEQVLTAAHDVNMPFWFWEPPTLAGFSVAPWLAVVSSFWAVTREANGQDIVRIAVAATDRGLP